MAIRLAVIFNHRKLSGVLTRLFTGCYAYHVAWVDEDRGVMYDMNLLRRRRAWPHYPEDQVEMFDAPAPARTRNAGGKICSEMVNDDIWACGGRHALAGRRAAAEPVRSCAPGVVLAHARNVGALHRERRGEKQGKLSR